MLKCLSGQSALISSLRKCICLLPIHLSLMYLLVTLETSLFKMFCNASEFLSRTWFSTS